MGASAGVETGACDRGPAGIPGSGRPNPGVAGAAAVLPPTSAPWSEDRGTAGVGTTSAGMTGSCDSTSTAGVDIGTGTATTGAMSASAADARSASRLPPRRRVVHAAATTGVMHVHALAGRDAASRAGARQAAKRSRNASGSVTGSAAPSTGRTGATDRQPRADSEAPDRTSGCATCLSPALVDPDIDAPDLCHVAEPVPVDQIQQGIRRPVEVVGEIGDLLIQPLSRPDQDSPRRSPAPGPAGSTLLIRS